MFWSNLTRFPIIRGRRSGQKSGGTEAGGRDEWGGVGVFDKEYFRTLRAITYKKILNKSIAILVACLHLLATFGLECRAFACKKDTICKQVGGGASTPPCPSPSAGYDHCYVGKKGTTACSKLRYIIAHQFAYAYWSLFDSKQMFCYALTLISLRRHTPANVSMIPFHVFQPFFTAGTAELIAL